MDSTAIASQPRDPQDVLPLPNELLTLICSKTSNVKSIKNFRLVCKTFGAIGSQCLFEEVRVILTAESLDRLEKIASNKDVCAHVKYLRIFPHLLRDNIKTNYVTFMKESERTGDVSATMNVVQRWQKYSQLREEQQALLVSGRWVRCIVESIERMQDLSGIMLEERLEFGQFPQAFVPTSTDHKGKVGLTGIFYLLDLGVDTVFPVLAALNPAKLHRKLRLLDVKVLDWRIFDPEHATLDTLKDSVHSIKELRLAYRRSAVHDNDYADGDREAGGVGSFLASARALRSLEVKILNERDHLTSVIFTTEMLFGNTSWPNFSELTLCGVTIHADQFLQFLKRQKGILEKLHLGDRLRLLYEGMEDCWTEFLREIAAMQAIPSFSLDDTGYLQYAKGSIFNDHPVGDFGTLTRARAIRYLVCGRKTDERENEDTVSVDPDNCWGEITWDDIHKDFLYLLEDSDSSQSWDEAFSDSEEVM